MNLIKDDSGATSIEYAILASLVAVIIVVAVSSIGNTLEGIFTNVTRGFRTSN
ncbi:MAG: Flp family type IVb pilin [Alphaproteobacteria bacterium]|nr:Flp family type IVb pilin [Alphaproteobacteria bacterium]